MSKKQKCAHPQCEMRFHYCTSCDYLGNECLSEGYCSNDCWKAHAPIHYAEYWDEEDDQEQSPVVTEEH